MLDSEPLELKDSLENKQDALHARIRNSRPAPFHAAVARVFRRSGLTPSLPMRGLLNIIQVAAIFFSLAPRALAATLGDAQWAGVFDSLIAPVVFCGLMLYLGCQFCYQLSGVSAFLVLLASFFWIYQSIFNPVGNWGRLTLVTVVLSIFNAAAFFGAATDVALGRSGSGRRRLSMLYGVWKTGETYESPKELVSTGLLATRLCRFNAIVLALSFVSFLGAFVFGMVTHSRS